MGINPTRNFDLLYIMFDTAFLLVFMGLLIWKKKYLTVLWALFGGILYFIVDFGYFYLISGSRTVSVNGIVSGGGVTALVLLWMSLSYGITNFAFIWLCLGRDENLKEWLILIIGWWIAAPSLVLNGSGTVITTFRTTSAYHGVMAAILIIGYLAAIIYNLKSENKKIPVLRLNAIGFSVQFFWEFALLVNGIRPLNGASIVTLIINSCIETNLGMPYIFLIYCFITGRLQENLKPAENTGGSETEETERETALI